MNTTPVTVYRLQNYEAPGAAAAVPGVPAIPGMPPVPPEIQKWLSAGASPGAAGIAPLPGWTKPDEVLWPGRWSPPW